MSERDSDDKRLKFKLERVGKTPKKIEIMRPE